MSAANSSPRRVLILHASAGQGHAKAADAIAASFRLLHPEITLEVHDALDFFPRWLKRTYVGFYLLLLHHAPSMWGWCYAMTDWPDFLGLRSVMRRCFNGLFASKLEIKILREKPDVIYTTHFLGAEVLAYLKRRKQLGSKTITVITDILVHRLWIFKETDLYTVAMQKTKDVLMKEGIDPARIVITGIPIDPKFSRKGNRDEICRRHGLDPLKKTLLVTSGGSGAGPTEKIVHNLLQSKTDLQIALVCGRNEALYQGMSRLASRHRQLKPFGFVDFMDELMDCADAVVGKAGGLTLSEALAKELPFFILSPVPGQETLNTQSLVEAGASVHVANIDNISGDIHKVLMNAEVLNRMKQSIRLLAKPQSGRSVMELGLKER